MLTVIKRDGRTVPFDKTKIQQAVHKVFIAVDGALTPYAEEKAINIADYVEKYFTDKKQNQVGIEEIQDLVEKGLMSTRRKDTARAYITYRNARNEARGNLTDKAFLDFLSGKNDYWNKENSNKDATIVTTQRDYLAGISSTDLARRFLLPKEVCDAHDAGTIHQHDMDYMAQKALSNCCLVNLEDMLLNGTVINGVQIDPQHRLLTAATVATQIITAVASSQYGGTTITLTHLAPFVRDSFARYYKDGLAYLNNITTKTIDYSIETMLLSAKEYSIKDSEYEAYSPAAYSYAMDMLKREIKDAVQTFNYQINSMSTTNGQAPFLSVNMWVSENPKYEYEVSLLIEEFLKQRILGLKNEKGVYVTQAFPKLLYVLDENNTYEESKYFELTKLAATCTAKRMVPDYISAKKMREYKVSAANGTHDVYPCMGCRSFLTPDRCSENYAKAKNYQPGVSKYYGRFNVGVTTINLVDVAFSSKGDIDLFWDIFDRRAELCHKGLLARIERLESVTSDVAPILWQHGALARLEPGESLKDIIHNGYATASLGYAGLYECVKYMTGQSHTDEGIGERFGLEVMAALNDKCAEWKAAENIDYSVYGTPIESGTYKFAKTLKQRFGNDVFIQLDGKDRDYITNSYHVPVFEDIDAFNKLIIESKFQALSPGGAISYIETANLTNNIPAVIQVIQFIYENIMYAEMNTKSDYCHDCGYTGEILIDDNMEWYCPNCGNRDQKKMNVARRTCGYIGAHFWNYGRTQEIKERVVHLE